ncbi:N-acetylmuramoyl-L-alanine amidase [Crenalkalicoccus roseus]|uniref:N-acetylmuramoyl-L-alanine amidase n=1 Tax=Crenalkalicoccus roseus TaxID=1485588 RepID=UPI00186424B2|nr:N-acetylmuramoyl-L-alanine amidase [Crenalkalicoccus roseus]
MSLRIRDLPSPNHDPRPEGAQVDTLVLHYTGMRTAKEAIARLRDPDSRVSAHYVVEEDGRVWRLVPEARRAWHAGVSHWRGREALNGRSIGIEVVNPGHEWGYRPFPALQMAALCDLCLEILARHPIAPRDVVAHSDIAPDRKQDPGELFDWEGLAANGVGLWPAGVPGGDAAPAEEGAALPLLGAIGYRTDLPVPVLLTAFQRHWRPERVDGRADAGTLARLAAVAALCAGGR